MRILIVNNSQEESGLLYRAAGFLGFVSDCVRSGDEAIQCHLQQRNDLILLSINLPDYDICSTAQAIRQLERTKIGFTPSLMCGLLTVYDAGIHESCLKNGMDTCVVEPCSSLEAIDLLESLRKASGRLRHRGTIKKDSSCSGLQVDRRLLHLKQML